MIGLLDPALLLHRDEGEIQQELNEVIRICRSHSIELVPIRDHWKELWQELGSPLQRRVSPATKLTLRKLKELVESSKSTIPPLEINAGKVWIRGFSQLFGSQFLGTTWEDRVSTAALRAVATHRRVIVLVRRVEGRNLVIHKAGHSLLHEMTRWVLHVQPKVVGHRQLLCVYHRRNLMENWTTRFDWRLPTTSDKAKYPFCPPDAWWKGSTEAFRTLHSRPAWIDKQGNGWARPDIPDGKGYHWDVSIESPNLQRRVGLNQINVVEFGAPATEGFPGHLHHVPSEKMGKVTDVGWRC